MARSQRSTEDSRTSFKELASDVVTLVRQEVDLAKAELAQKVKSAGIGAGMIGASTMTGFLTLASLTALLIVALALAIPLWAAVLAVTVLWGAVTAGLMLLGKRKVEDAAPFVPEQTIEKVKEDVEWARRGAKQLRS